MAQYGDSTVYYSSIGDRHSRCIGKLRSSHVHSFACQTTLKSGKECQAWEEEEASAYLKTGAPVHYE
jgi:hypothetical protein